MTLMPSQKAFRINPDRTVKQKQSTTLWRVITISALCIFIQLPSAFSQTYREPRNPHFEMQPTDKDRSKEEERKSIPLWAHPFLGMMNHDFQSWTKHRFDSYRTAYITSTGRVIDRENRSITHSEGQGYAMLFALQADDAVTFDRLWRFAKENLQRPDALFSWRYDPSITPHVDDPNNASDGDILIATALALAAIRWDKANYMIEARRIARAIRNELVVKFKGYTLLLPGAEGFQRDRVPLKFSRILGISQTQSPIINMSYWIYPSFSALNAIDPSPVWGELKYSGILLLQQSEYPPTEWSVVSEDGRLEPAPGRVAEFGYNAVRVPLYLLLSGYRIPRLYQRLISVWGKPSPNAPFTFDYKSNQKKDYMNLAGFRLLHELIYCAETGKSVGLGRLYAPAQTYFSASVHFLATNALYTYLASCFPVDAGP